MEITRKYKNVFFFVFLNSSVFFRVFRGKKHFLFTLSKKDICTIYFDD